MGLMDEKRQCYVCKAVADLKETHHIIPQSKGGKKGPTLSLCVGCHSMAHLFAKRTEIALDHIAEKKEIGPRLAKVVEILRLSENLPHASFYKVNVSIPDTLYVQVKQAAKDNSVSISNYIIGILQKETKRGKL